jgi:hypothetical protein
MNYLVRVGFDKDARRYFVIDSEIPGLNVETETFEEFVAVTEDVAAELVDTADQDLKIRFEREITVAA